MPGGVGVSEGVAEFVADGMAVLLGVGETRMAVK